MTSSSLWLMSGILTILKRGGFQPSDPTLFSVALPSVSASLSQQARSSSAGASFVRSKRRESLLMHTSIPVPEAQRRSLTVAPGSTSGLFNEDILSEVVARVQHSSLISSNLEVSCFLLLSAFGSLRLGSSSCWPAVREALCILFLFLRAQAL